MYVEKIEYHFNISHNTKIITYLLTRICILVNFHFSYMRLLTVCHFKAWFNVILGSFFLPCCSVHMQCSQIHCTKNIVNWPSVFRNLQQKQDFKTVIDCLLINNLLLHSRLKQCRVKSGANPISEWLAWNMAFTEGLKEALNQELSVVCKALCWFRSFAS